MAIQTVPISASQRDHVLSYSEGHFLDLKAIEIKPGKLSQTISAFANADGGELFIGVAENKAANTRKWCGFSDDEAANGHLQAFETLFPLGQDFLYEFLTCEGQTGLVLHVLIHKTRDIKKASNSTPYVRRGAQNLPVDSAEKLRRLELDKGIVSFETDTVSAEHDTISNSIVLLKFLLDVVPIAEPEPWLKKQQLLRDSKPTVAGVLLFSEEPQALLPKRCGVKIYRYKTKDAQGTRDTLAFDPVTVEGHLYDQVKAAVARTVQVVQELQVLDTSGLHKISYPPETLHEIITNALIHRDYSIADDVHVRIFDNRIEVESPGRLPGHVTPDNILKERVARNGQIVRLINKFPNPPNKDVGEGLNTAFEAMRKLQLKDPTIEETKSSVLVSIRHERLASPEVAIMEYLGTHPQVTNSVARDLCHIGSENKVKRVFEKMINSGLIEKVPGSKGNKTAYRKKQ
jgi:ATP-dependent DNA helicase RecG